MTFEQLEELFFTLKINASPSGFHGFLCGRLCCDVVGIEELVMATSGWLALSEEQTKEVESTFEAFYSASINSLKDVSFLFQPVLPDDELPLTERLVAVGEWCSNYISGLGDGMDQTFKLSDDGKEALEDIAAIGQVSVDFETDDDGERDYVELVEFIRIAVQVVFSELRPEADPRSEPTIH